MAAKRRGLTPDGPWWAEGWGRGVFVPVGPGVVKVEGSSDVNIVFDEGEMRYLAFKVASRASLKPENAWQC